MPITALPTPPTRQDPANFAVRADDFLAALPDFATEANALASDVNADEISAAASAATATTQAGIATTQAGIATTQAGIATTKAAEALASADAAAASFDSFDDRYLGSKASDPTLDNDGNALLTGAMYWNSSLSELRFWSGSAWLTANLVVGSYLAKAGDTATGQFLVEYSSAGVSGRAVLGIQNTESGSGGAIVGTSSTSTDASWGGATLADAMVIRSHAAAAGGLGLMAGANAPISFWVNGVEEARIDATGLGIGKTPGANLDYRETINVISTNTTAVASRTYVITANLTLTLPASPTAGDWVKVSNRSGVTTPVIGRNAQNIMGLAENMTLDDLNSTVTLTFADATRGWVLI